MSQIAYVQALGEFARSRALRRGTWDAMLASLCPEFLEKNGAELAACRQPAIFSLFSTLVFQIGRELQELAGDSGTVLSAQQRDGGYLYQVKSLPHYTNTRGLLELCRFGVALDLDGPDLLQKVQETALASLKKEVQGAWRVAQRRWKSYTKLSGKMHAAGDALHVQARRVESALSVSLSDQSLLCSRADLATDWLAGVDLWLHAPHAAAAKGGALALSLLKSKQIQQKKVEAGNCACTLWTPHSLALRLVQALSAVSAETAQACWATLGKPGDVDLLAQRLRSSLLALAKLGRGVHPSSHADELVTWLRELRSEAK